MEKLKVGVVIFFIICSAIWAQEINPKPQKAPLCEITIVPVESLANIHPYITVISPTAIYNEPNESTPIIYQAKSGQTFTVFEEKDDWYKVSKAFGWVRKGYVKEHYKVEKINSIKHNGRILYVADSFLIFWKTQKPYDSRIINDFSIKIPYSEIDKVSITTTGKNKLLWVIPGVAIGSLAGSYMGYLLSSSSDQTQETGDVVNDFANALGDAFAEGITMGCCMTSGGILGGLVSTQILAYKNVMINGEYAQYKSFSLALKKSSIFPFVPSPELQPFLEK
jgi:hypothetical protein